LLFYEVEFLADVLITIHINYYVVRS